MISPELMWIIQTSGCKCKYLVNRYIVNHAILFVEKYDIAKNNESLKASII